MFSLVSLGFQPQGHHKITPPASQAVLLLGMFKVFLEVLVLFGVRAPQKGLGLKGHLDLDAVDPSAKSFTFCGFNGKPLDFRKS